ncbi:uncharacterized protein JN550_006253 [Neoarthrinium moseri]|uniref:uncharacterized protein n=1 Tax=Neoarthrinium moseri TaxID=1658444 RepID=UPI001FDCAD02|nr:uncharacterized protein JN550_006253 [Neoarthrinium moseri]KAI1868678.1 hypothetical protein JN550_006253 [Neoarthrinium moseri]
MSGATSGFRKMIVGHDCSASQLAEPRRGDTWGNSLWVGYLWKGIKYFDNLDDTVCWLDNAFSTSWLAR